MVPPLVLREGGGGGGRGRVTAPPSLASSPSASSWSARHVRKRLAAGRKGARPGRRGAGMGVEGRGAVSRCVPQPPCSPVRQPMSSAGLRARALPLGGGGRGAGVGEKPPVATGARGSRSAATAVTPVLPPTPHRNMGPRATAWAGPRLRRGPSALCSTRGALVGCGRIDTPQPGRGSGK